MSKPVWTLGKKLMGNLIPAAVALPPGVAGVFLMLRDGVIFGPGLVLFSVSPVLAWLSMNFLGLYANGAIRRSLERRFRLGPPDPSAPRFFVGFARPAYRGLLDPHEDIGFLFLHPDKLEFRGDTQQAVLPRESIRTVTFRRNPHSWVLLGRWVSVEGEVEGVPVRMLLEPRERPTLWGNRRFSTLLRDRLEAWRRG